MTDNKTCDQCGGLEPCGIHLCTQLRDTIAGRDSWRIRAEAAEALVRQMRGEADELGIQYRAAQDRLRLATACIEAARGVVGLLPDNTRTYLSCIQLRDLLAKWRVVPGDAKECHE